MTFQNCCFKGTGEQTTHFSHGFGFVLTQCGNTCCYLQGSPWQHLELLLRRVITAEPEIMSVGPWPRASAAHPPFAPTLMLAPQEIATA